MRMGKFPLSHKTIKRVKIGDNTSSLSAAFKRVIEFYWSLEINLIFSESANLTKAISSGELA